MMKKYLKIGCLTVLVGFVMFIQFLFILGLIFSKPSEKDNKLQESQTSSINVCVSEETPEQIKTRNDSIIKVFRSDFTLKKEEFSNEDEVFVIPKNKPRYRNTNKIYCYFELYNNSACNFRFVVQYASSEWLFIKQMTFNIVSDQGIENIVFIPEKMETDNYDTIWEWCDESISVSNEYLIYSIAYAKQVKVKFEGLQYTDIRTLSTNEIKYIQKTYEFYTALGGKFY